MSKLDQVIRFIVTRHEEILANFGYSLGYLILLPTVIAICIAVPLAVLIVKKPKMQWLMQVFNFLNTVPAMIMFTILVICNFGLGLKPSLVSLVIYAIIPILVSAVPALQAIDNSKGLSLGMNWFQSIIYIDLPLASPAIVTGIKLSMIYGISNSILCASIGAEGLGKYVMLGLAQMRLDYQIVGAVPLIILAMLFELLGSYFSSKLAKLTKQEA